MLLLGALVVASLQTPRRGAAAEWQGGIVAGGPPENRRDQQRPQQQACKAVPALARPSPERRRVAPPGAW